MYGKEIMEDKYYTPEIEEFHIGFEYEGRLAGVNGGVTDWEKRIFFKEQLPFIKGCEETLEHFRVKYLDKEDIESFGFTKYVEFDNLYTLKINDITYHLIVISNDFGKHKYEIRASNPSNSYGGFYGTIKNKSELKKILKQTGIEKK